MICDFSKCPVYLTLSERETDRPGSRRGRAGDAATPTLRILSPSKVARVRRRALRGSPPDNGIH
jgi:hypothetical protein